MKNRQMYKTSRVVIVYKTNVLLSNIPLYRVTKKLIRLKRPIKKRENKSNTYLDQ